MTLKDIQISVRTEDGQQRNITIRVATADTDDELQDRIELAVKREFDPTAELGDRLNGLGLPGNKQEPEALGE